MSKPNTGNSAAAKAAAEKAAAERATAEKATAEKKAAEKVAAEKVAAEKAAAEKAAAEAAEQGKTVMVPALSVVSGREGFRRGGRAWGKEEQIVKLSELTTEQIEQIKGESLLTVTEIEIEEQAAE